MVFEELAKGRASIFAPPARMCCSPPQRDVSASSCHSGPHLPLWERMELRLPEEKRSGLRSGPAEETRMVGGVAAGGGGGRAFVPLRSELTS